MGNPVTHWQILSRRPEVSEKFYSELFAWDVTTDNALSYRQIDTKDQNGINGGIWPIAGDEGHPMAQLFIKVDNVTEHLEKAVALGARVIVPPQTLPEGDEMAIICDPEGVSFAIFSGPDRNPN